ncbi:uncharacterized protein F5Z01DRAFT_643535 [Emericellopsis atlantica]|uniref:Secreted protein n=1 Tax=Emericellopsis atlantica TaxID=2614577 RepID=A0A9P7ZUF7_9HYPO|nr:uncharacterized protein F5Z01DRAFT_643535 [Emericellopsis atlantica]KAG9258549.1 hypothetical protein F5Z01DRAFT_643535 [Emericellopsis atlantica]
MPERHSTPLWLVVLTSSTLMLRYSSVRWHFAFAKVTESSPSLLWLNFYARLPCCSLGSSETCCCCHATSMMHSCGLVTFHK